MSDEKSNAVSQRELGLALLTFQSSASQADAHSQQRRTNWIVLAAVESLPALVSYGLAVQALWLATHGGQWQDFWIFALAASAWTVFVFVLLLIVTVRGFSLPKLQYLDKGIQALRQAATTADNRLAPIHAPGNSSDADESEPSEASSDTVTLGPLERLDGRRPESFVRLGSILLLVGLFGVGTALYRYTAFPNLHDPTINQDFAIFAGLLVLGMLAIAIAAFWLSTFTVTGDEKGFHWQQLAFSRLGRRSAQGLWQDVRAFVTFTMRQGDGGDAGIFLLDMTNEALAWRITPKTPANVREAHERFVRLANEHVPLRDITASLKNLLESPETRSYEYAVTALSGPVPVPPAVRKILTTPVRVSHFLRGYLIVATILLALLVAAALLMQSGLIPPNAF